MSWIRHTQSKIKSNKIKINTLLENTIIEKPINVENTINETPIYVENITENNDTSDLMLDAILYINLSHRPDRNEHCLNEIKKIDNTLSKTHRIDAIYSQNNGALGCTLSHIKALNLILENPTWYTVLILEDDFTFFEDNSEKIINNINYLIKKTDDFDILLLGLGIKDTHIIPTKNNLISKVNSSQTTSAYIIKKHYVPLLLENFKESSELMITNGYKPQYCCDQNWKKLIPNGKWFTLNNRIGYQFANISDIEGTIVDYKC